VTTHYRFEKLTRPGGMLHGLSTGDADTLALHIHGTWGNFYENPFALGIAETYVSAGYRYASVNNPGHDGGSINEDFDESTSAILGWVEALQRPQDSGLVLQGHSLGALKLLRLLSAAPTPIPAVSGLVLLSPFDLVAFYAGVGQSVAARREAARAQAKLHGDTAILDTSVFDTWPIGVDAYLRATEVGGPWDLFPTRDGSVGRLASIGLPTLVVLGSADFAATPTVSEVARLVRDHVPEANVHVIQDAPHNFAGYEKQLYSVVGSFLRSIPSVRIEA
jgi:pimeloyl-ACP methyl ester carboxylesterase